MKGRTAVVEPLSRALFLSKREDWATPRALAKAVVLEFGIQLDVCASAENAIVPRFLSKEENALLQPWRGVCWMNPPYGRAVGDWVCKASVSAHAGATVVCLLPSRTDTRWWHAFAEPVLHRRRPGEVRFLRGRLTFGGAPGPAPFPSVLLVFRGAK